MKKILITTFILSAILVARGADAQMMGSRNFGVSQEIYEHTVREESEGKELWQKFRAKEVNCTNLTDEQFGTLGEYFMGTMMGDSHAAMNAMMMQMHGEDGEEQIHIVMGKRLSGCDISATVPGIVGGWMPMMNMMTGGMNSGFGPVGFLGGLFIILWWVLIIVAIAALVKWLASQFRGSITGKSALDIIKEPYAKGEIK